jgi:hypothetical protein
MMSKEYVLFPCRPQQFLQQGCRNGEAQAGINAKLQLLNMSIYWRRRPDDRSPTVSSGPENRQSRHWFAHNRAFIREGIVLTFYLDRHLHVSVANLQDSPEK